MFISYLIIEEYLLGIMRKLSSPLIIQSPKITQFYFFINYLIKSITKQLSISTQKSYVSILQKYLNPIQISSIMSKFTQSILQSLPSTIPLALAVVSFAAAISNIAQSVSPMDLPVQYASAVMLVSLSAIFFAFYILIRTIENNHRQGSINEASMVIAQGSQYFFKQQYNTILKYSIVIAIILSVLYGLASNPLNLHFKEGQTPISGFKFSLLIGFSFLFGVVCSGLSSFVCLWASARTNLRVAEAAKHSSHISLQLAFTGGYFEAMINTSLAMFGVSIVFIAFFKLLISNGVAIMGHLQMVPLLMVSFGFGTAILSMFSHLGGRMHKEAIDNGNDLLGKINEDFPINDKRNPAFTANFVVNNVGEGLGQGADFFGSITIQIIVSMILGARLGKMAHLDTYHIISYMFFPLAFHSINLVSSTVALFFVTKEKNNESKGEDVLEVLKRGYLFAWLTGVSGFCILCLVLLRISVFPLAWMMFSMCGLVGAFISYYFITYRSPHKNSLSTATIIPSLSAGIQTVGLPVITISIGVIVSYHLGMATGISNLEGNLIGGLFGIAAATMGILCTEAYVLSINSFSLIVNNASGIIQMNEEKEEFTQNIISQLYAASNTIKVRIKGYPITCSAMTCFILLSMLINKANLISTIEIYSVDISIPEVFVGGLLGSLLVFIFASWTIKGVDNISKDLVKEYRRQISQDVIEKKSQPDFDRFLHVMTIAGQREIVKPVLLSIFSPIVLFLIFKYIGCFTYQENLGQKALYSFLMFSTVTGTLIALSLNNNSRNSGESSLHILGKVLCSLSLVILPILV